MEEYENSILAVLPKQYDESLNDESLRTLLVEVEGLVNSRPTTYNNTGDVNSIVPLNPIQLLRMITTKIIMPPNGIFQKIHTTKNIGNRSSMYVIMVLTTVATTPCMVVPPLYLFPDAPLPPPHSTFDNFFRQYCPNNAQK